MDPRKRLNLPPKLRKIVDRALRSGRYRTENEVLADALELMAAKNAEHDAYLESLRAGARRGMADVKAGRVIPAELVTVDSIMASVRKRQSSSRRHRKSA
jgi:Arc/MetJ-type ribon-helix-helix transcriptional regulator